MRRRPQHADRLSLPAALQGQDGHARHGAATGRGPRARPPSCKRAGRHPGVRRGRGGALRRHGRRSGRAVRICRGGNGGFGNAYFKIRDQPGAAPRQPRRGRARSARSGCRLKLIADAGLVGLPNAGKSTVLWRPCRPPSRRSATIPSPPCIPQLGVVACRRARVRAGGHSRPDRGGARGRRASAIGFWATSSAARVILHLVDAVGANMRGSDYQHGAPRARRLRRRAHGQAARSSPCPRSTRAEPDHLKKQVERLRRACGRHAPAPVVGDADQRHGSAARARPDHRRKSRRGAAGGEGRGVAAVRHA